MFRRALLNTRFAQPVIRTPFIQQGRFISTEIKDAIDRAVGSSKVVLFMKGTPEFPQCGFSRATIQMLGQQGVDPEKFAAYNVLEDPELRDGIKEYSEWPTIPQLYVNKEFVGGCDIVMSMAQSGELSDLLEANECLIPEEEGETTSANIQPNERS
ncbi:DEHA2F25476p [Debaryomyces hansenii CBS767]|uniref:Monothiol glutaredoxin-5, mitochondrial n=1 Tax=Debaryomyces hansenii (strain ATCC 36239 / CBS 767 / BCRC 21394 / JCM 1990 / NBRC 0083 / IGC 2968) TaxID=284592 RepID=B5RUN6_DEBHA|nr:DEHA2F25476p [Debaryomyces hansenii CBS767]CAR66414.1 DEHA2F25476p [Debaryomyces hansenii CBS767]|eukprot:XP_002770898.1 DEHA2F25476p [Debaryomyces hansenii CBS767]